MNYWPSTSHGRWSSARVVKVVTAHNSGESVRVGQHVSSCQFVVVRILVSNNLACMERSRNNARSKSTSVGNLKKKGLSQVKKRDWYTRTCTAMSPLVVMVVDKDEGPVRRAHVPAEVDQVAQLAEVLHSGRNLGTVPELCHTAYK